MRALYKERYDSRSNLIDWDYHMRVLDFAPIIHATQYRNWRDTGIAFETRDVQYTQPNRSLASYTEVRLHGKAVAKRGLWCDIANSPYWTFGIEADDKALFERASMQQKHTAQDVCVHNLTKWVGALDSAEWPLKVGFLEGADAAALAVRRRWRGPYDVVFLSSLCAKWLAESGLRNLGMHVVVETPRAVVQLREADRMEWMRRFMGIAGKYGVKMVDPQGYTSDPGKEMKDGDVASYHIVVTI